MIFFLAGGVFGAAFRVTPGLLVGLDPILDLSDLILVRSIMLVLSSLLAGGDFLMDFNSTFCGIFPFSGMILELFL